MNLRSFTPWLLLLATVLTACANRMPASRLDPRIQYQGFSAARPPNDQWFLLRSEQSDTALLFRRTVGGTAHSVVFSAQLGLLSDAAIPDADFPALVEKKMTQVCDPERFSVVSYEGEVAPRQGQLCVRYAMETLDRKNPAGGGAGSSSPSPIRTKRSRGEAVAAVLPHGCSPDAS